MKKTVTVQGRKVDLPDNPTNEEIKEALGQYCPFCKKNIYPSNVEEFMSGLHDGFIFIHEEVAHDEDYDFKPLQ